MRSQIKEEGIRQLACANEGHNRRWRLWQYLAADNTLVLCGEDDTFNVSGFLFFRGTTYINLWWSLREAVFQISESDTVKNQLDSNGASNSDQLEISIFSEGDLFSVVCREVQFYPASESNCPFEQMIGAK